MINRHKTTNMIRKNDPPPPPYNDNNDNNCWFICCIPCMLITGCIIQLFKSNSCVEYCNCKYNSNVSPASITSNIYEKYNGKVWGIK